MLAGAVAPGDAHTIGIQMVCDLAAFDGWDTVVLPAGLDHAQTLAALIATKPHVIALSAAMAAHVGNLVTLVNDIRSCGQLTGVPLIVGGSPFTRFPHLAEIIGADATADDAAEAVELFRRFAMRVAAPR
jgi:methanogenic corrinoid protein MtbC1